LRKILMIMLCMVVSGCAAKKAVVVDEVNPTSTAVSEAAVLGDTVSGMPEVVEEASVLVPGPLNVDVAYTYDVVKGDCLWDIAGKKNVYADSFQWPLLWKANRDQIQNPDLIEVGWRLNVGSDYSIPYMMEVRKEAEDYGE